MPSKNSAIFWRGRTRQAKKGSHNFLTLPKAGTRKFLKQMIKPGEQPRHEANTGLSAANEFLRLNTSGACHATHMPSHIYGRFGNWSQSLNSNLLAIKVNYKVISHSSA